MESNILIVDDDPGVVGVIEHYLAKHGFQVRHARDGAAMRKSLAESIPDVILIDLALPGEDGLSLIRFVRQHYDMGIIIVSGSGEDVDRIVGLEIGGDDYIQKPVNLRELLARVRSVLRRAGRMTLSGSVDNLSFDGWRLDRARRVLISPQGGEVELTTAEYDLLVVFLEHPNQVLSRDRLLELTRNRTAGPFDRAIDMLVARLRRKLEDDPGHPALLKSVRAAGYVFTGTVERQ